MAVGPDLPAGETGAAERARAGSGAFGRAIGTVLFFAAIGPLIGGLVLGAPDILRLLRDSADLGATFYFILAFASVGLPVAYAMSLVPAAIVGLFFALVDFGRQRSSLWLAVVIGALGGVLWPVPWDGTASMLASPLERQAFFASVVSTVLCWFVSTLGTRQASPR